MSDYIQKDTPNSGIDIVQLINGTSKVVPITTAEAVVWHEGDTNMTLRQKIEKLNPTPGETITSYTAGRGIDIDNNNTINVLVDDKTIEFNDQNKLQVKDLTDQISSALSNYLGPNTLIKTAILGTLPTEDMQSDTLYLIGSNNNSGDSFEEYIWIKDASIVPNGGYWEKLGTTQFDMNKLEKVYSAIFETVQEDEINKFKKVYEVVFSKDSTENEVNNIGENSDLINKIRTELGPNDDQDSTIYDRLNKLETDYRNISGLSFGEIKYELTYDYDIDSLYSKKTN